MTADQIALDAEQRETYLNLADEASMRDFTRADFDDEYLADADEYAERHGLPKADEVGDLDLAYDLVRHIKDEIR